MSESAETNFTDGDVKIFGGTIQVGEKTYSLGGLQGLACGPAPDALKWAAGIAAVLATPIAVGSGVLLARGADTAGVTFNLFTIVAAAGWWYVAKGPRTYQITANLGGLTPTPILLDTRRERVERVLAELLKATGRGRQE